MLPAPRSPRCLSLAVAGLLAASVLPVCYGAPALAAEPDPETPVLIQIKARAFEPNRVVLTLGKKTWLVLHNQDAELHAFVPVGLLTGVNFNVGGNGAPEFGPEGFKRVIIPSEGRAEFRFVPERPGVFPFFCDMPGHEMKATIVVEPRP